LIRRTFTESRRGNSLARRPGDIENLVEARIMEYVEYRRAHIDQFKAGARGLLSALLSEQEYPQAGAAMYWSWARSMTWGCGTVFKNLSARMREFQSGVGHSDLARGTLSRTCSPYPLLTGVVAMAVSVRAPSFVHAT
jgi:hypothetical protein